VAKFYSNAGCVSCQSTESLENEGVCQMFINVGERKKVYSPVWKCPLRIKKLNCVTLKHVEFMHLRLVI